MSAWSVIAAGELITDHLFLPQAGGGAVYAGARGGGSAFNVAACLAHWTRPGEGRVTAWGSGGDDPAGRLAVADLDAAGAGTAGLALLPRRRTRLIFERVGHGRPGAVGGTAHTFGTSCSVCGRRDQARSRPTLDAAAAALMPVPTADLLVLDRLSPARLRLARSLRSQGAATVLDLGAVDYLRYSPVVEILADLSGFDLLIMSEPVERSLLARAGLERPAQLADLTGLGLLVITRGPQGLTVVGGPAGSRRERHVAPAGGPVTDDAGAGDALLAGIVLGALRHAAGSGSRPRPAFDSRDVDTAAMLARQAVDRLPAVLGSDGARGHLTHRAPPSAYDKHVGADTDRLLERAHASGHCPVCLLPMSTNPEEADLADAGASPDASKEPDPHGAARTRPDRPRLRKPGSARNVSLLVARVLHAAEQDEAAGQAAALLRQGGNGYIVGSGGSYAAATYLAELARQTPAGPFVTAVRPADFLRTRRPVDIVIAVSYSGATSDLAHVLTHAARLGVEQLVLLTAARRPRLASHLRPLSQDMLMVYGPAGDGARAGLRERGFVSMAATVMPVIPFVRSQVDLADLIDLTGRLRAALPETQAAQDLARHHAAHELILIGGGWAGPALTDVEGKFAEADLGPTRVDEPKDFSHGRFVSVLGAGPRDRPKQPVLMLSAGPLTRYEGTLSDALRQDGHHVSEIRSAGGGPLGGLELLCRVQRFSQQYGEALGIDISRPSPPPPESGLRLYRSTASPARH